SWERRLSSSRVMGIFFIYWLFLLWGHHVWGITQRPQRGWERKGFVFRAYLFFCGPTAFADAA
ncbi:MAG: hypothetical protein K2M83_05300, partial [Muribaculaceae bacterium]|nr:hypothetical protein [Muribaculaceae bacterium]